MCLTCVRSTRKRDLRASPKRCGWERRGQEGRSTLAGHLPVSCIAQAHKSTVWLGRHLPQNRDLFLTTGGNGGLNIYRYIYPRQRVVEDSKGQHKGVAGSVELLNARVVSSQPIIGFDWSPDKEGLAVAASLDQAVRVFIVTKLDRF